MVSRVFFATLLVFGSHRLVAQQHNVTHPSSAIKLPLGTLPIDDVTFRNDVTESYYHPDDLSELDCSVAIGWDELFKAINQKLPADRLLVLRGLNVQSRAVRGKVPELTFDWGGGSLDTKDQVEASMRQMVGGFYQMYWSMVAGSLFSKTDKISKIEPLVDGGAIASIVSGQNSVTVTVDKDHVPTKAYFDSPIMKGGSELRYTPSANPVPGDLRRLTSMSVTEEMGTSKMNVDVNLDYQTVGGFHIPKHASFNVVGALSIGFDFSACSVSKEVVLGTEAK